MNSLNAELLFILLLTDCKPTMPLTSVEKFNRLVTKNLYGGCVLMPLLVMVRKMHSQPQEDITVAKPVIHHPNYP
ncbi:hypothetical protein OIU85_012465 [Salix viminalis]|uniref:Uncharacterized protein n=1 Tax=Salix viminalis TaxID=40686 RepID=A0A9Q0NPD1_SALVM|nr:hypothetical protein OIU85_012465 [Salix viminalis]